MRRVYGHGPLHLVAHLALIAFTAWALAQMFGLGVAPQPLNLVLWLALGAVVHDLVILPAYALVDRAIRLLPPAAINHVRFAWLNWRTGSILWSALGHEPPDYLGRWLAVTGGLIAASALVYAVRRLRGSRAAARPPSGR